jgi:hypothetical protein
MGFRQLKEEVVQVKDDRFVKGARHSDDLCVGCHLTAKISLQDHHICLFYRFKMENTFVETVNHLPAKVPGWSKNAKHGAGGLALN